MKRLDSTQEIVDLRRRANLSEGYGAVFAKGNPLIPYVSKALKTLQTNGTIGKLTKRWFGFDPTTVPVLK